LSLLFLCITGPHLVLLPSRAHGVRRRALRDGRLMALLKAHAIRKLHGSVIALDGVSLAIREGEFVSVIGPNGAGKTTLVNVLTGLVPPTSGTVKFKGRDIAGIGPVRLARLGMARSFQPANV